jgi:hypothetical protein
MKQRADDYLAVDFLARFWDGLKFTVPTEEGELPEIHICVVRRKR